MDPLNECIMFYEQSLKKKRSCKLGNYETDSFFEPRMSLLGKPLNYNRGTRRGFRYRRLQSRIYNFLERPRGIPAVIYHIMVFLMVFTCLALSVFSTIEEYEKDALYILFRMEILVVVWFTMEFFLRLWSSGCRSRYQGCAGRMKFMKRPFCFIDIITIVPSIIVLGMGTSGQVFATSALRGLRFFQILRMVRMDRRGGTWKLLGSVVYAHRQELITTMYIGFLGLIFASFLVYLMEKDINAKFSNFAQALWWGVITLCTVGYGDMVPETWQGKLIASFCALLGISFFALPAGILGSGFALKVQQQQRQKHMIRRRQPAATLIQSVWRCYAADEHSLSIATWKIHQMPLPSPPASSEYWDRLFKNLSEYRRGSSSFKHNASFVARLPTIRRNKTPAMQSPGDGGGIKPQGTIRGGTRYARTLREMNASVENLAAKSPCKGSGCQQEKLSNIETGNYQQCNARYLTVPGRNNNTESDNKNKLSVGDVSTSIPIVLWGFLQRDILGSNCTIRRSSVCVADGEHLYDGMPYLESGNQVSIEGQYYPRNEEDEPRCTQLTSQHKIAIRFLRKLKYFVARRKFKEALKPYDVKDVMEQYAAGHVDLLGRVKNVHARLDQILGKQGSKSKDAYASKISLASRVVKVERQVADIEEKLDILIKAYMEDRERIQSLPLNTQAPKHSIQNQNDPSSLIVRDPKNSNHFKRAVTTVMDTPKQKQITHPSGITAYTQTSELNAYQTTTDSASAQVYQQHNDGLMTDLENRTKKRVSLRSTPQQIHESKSYNERDVAISLPADVQSLDSANIKSMPDSSIILIDEVEDYEEEDLNCEGEMDHYPSWDMDSDTLADVDVYCEESTENTALLHRRRPCTAIVITPISPVSSAHNLTSMDETTTSTINKSNLLSPDSG
ncbi:potassium voltage-gated channel subfamily KQT member 5 isoform X2 [Teleopsis dalmanni]|uniref:potassium voltage-gated channel subfamily KQT member 5 isoform X2 n=1 Tax=Teleopsis dalmanni TaxID=139649 RepID=UPI0018CE7B0D|nr:potassium voltage-gated channel subfamily KQT member 5 isoform X2 [Teleopsis dalmanni]